MEEDKELEVEIKIKFDELELAPAKLDDMKAKV